MEALFPGLAAQPWLGRMGAAVVAVLYLTAAGYLFYEYVIVPRFSATSLQMMCTVAVVTA